MRTTILLTLILCVLLFLMIWSALYFLPWKRLMDFMPEDVREKAAGHKLPFRTAPVFGWICLILCMLGFVGVIVYGGVDGVRRGYSFPQFLIRFLIILYGLKAFDIIGLDFFLLTKTHFVQHYLPETRGYAGYQNFGFNREAQLRRIIFMPFAAAFIAWICSCI